MEIGACTIGRCFDAVDFDKGNRPFDRLSSTEADELFSICVGIICRRSSNKSFSQAMILDDYRAINHKYLFAESYGFPYPALARACMGHVEQWAVNHSIDNQEILYFFEDGAKHKGQLEWIGREDNIPIPIFRKNKLLSLSQAGDLIAWCNNLYLTMEGAILPPYERALDRLSAKSHEWGLVNYQDPDRHPNDTPHSTP